MSLASIIDWAWVELRPKAVLVSITSSTRLFTMQSCTANVICCYPVMVNICPSLPLHLAKAHMYASDYCDMMVVPL